ncbi:MAG TPA: family 43 glycosylhydrolase, partial [Actinoplanes sp.]|nr:family 43 glycosylhydrolase [Actinoplanes sp.]
MLVSNWSARRRFVTAVVATLGLLVSVLVTVGVRQSSQAQAETTATTFTNPLVDNGADPWLTWHEGNYYLAHTTWNSQMVMRKAPTVAGLKTAKPVVIWSDTTAERCCNFWAPEFRLLSVGGTKRWYFTFTAGTNGTFGNQRMVVLESAGLDPMGPYTFKGRVADPQHDGFAIDGSYMELNNALYYVWSAFDGPQNLYIAKMSNPWTLAGPRSLLSTPQHDWEKAGDPVNEGPVALTRGGRTFLFYAASACNTPDYKLGRLAYTGGDPLNASSWSKSASPAFSRNDGGRAFGPGHNGFFTSPDGTEDWIVYHANPQAYANKDENCGSHRSTRIQKVRWNADGTPDLGTPVPLGDALNAPSGENAPMKPDVSVQGVAYNVVNNFSNKCLETTLGVRNDNANVAQRSCVSDPAAAAAQTQQWVVDSNGDGTYRLINRNSRKALSVLGCGKGDGANVVQAAWTGTACQSWKLTPTANGYVRIDEPASGKTLDVANCFTSEDVDV